MPRLHTACTRCWTPHTVLSPRLLRITARLYSAFGTLCCCGQAPDQRLKNSVPPNETAP